MQNYEENICLKLGLNPNQILKKKIRGLPGYTVKELVTALIYTDNILEAANKLGYTDNPIKQSIREILGPKFPERKQDYGIGGRSRIWKTELLLVIGYKKLHAVQENSITRKFRDSKQA